MARTKGATAKYLFLVSAWRDNNTDATTHEFKQKKAAERWLHEHHAWHRRVEIAKNSDLQVFLSVAYKPNETALLPDN